MPANGAADIVVRAKAGGKEIRDYVTVEGEETKIDVAVHAAPIPRMIQAAAVSTPQSSIIAQPPTPTRYPRLAAAANPQSPEPPAETAPPLLLQSFEDATQAQTGIPVTALQVVGVSQNEARVSCSFNAIAPIASFRAEAQTVIIVDGKAQPKWVPLMDAKMQIDGKTVTTDLPHLRPNMLYVLRIVGADAQGKIIAMSTSAAVWTPRAKPPHYWGWGAGIAVLAGGGWWIWRKRATR